MPSAARTTRQIPDQPGVDRSEQNLAISRARSGAGEVLEQPDQFESGEIARQRQARSRAQAIRPAVACKPRDKRFRARVHPDDRIAQRRAGRLVPKHGGLALIGDADRREIGPCGGSFRQGVVDHRERVSPDLRRVMLHPSGLRADLRMLAPGERHDLAGFVKKDEARAGRALIDRADEFGHFASAWGLGFAPARG